jgi:hypothetical protein
MQQNIDYQAVDYHSLHVSRTEEKRSAHRMFFGKSYGKRPLRRPRCRLEDNIKMSLKAFVCTGVEWICLGQDRGQILALVYAVRNLIVPQKADNSLTR